MTEMPKYIYESADNHGEPTCGTEGFMREIYETVVGDWECTVDDCMNECKQWEQDHDDVYERMFRGFRNRLYTEIARFTPTEPGAEEYTKEMIKRWDEETEEDDE